MRASESPFRCDWWGCSFADLGLDGLRPLKGTYGRYEYRHLPPVPLQLTGMLDWLAAAPRHKEHIGRHFAKKNPEAVEALKKAARRKRLDLPAAFLKFIETPALHRRVRSSTDCFLDVGRAPVPAPKGGGHLVRFLCDSQGCVFWYVYLTADGSDHGVVAALDFYGTPAELRAAAAWASEPPNPEEVVFCGESFEEFLARFWLENEVWFAAWQKTPMPAAGTEYLRRYRERQDELRALRPNVSRWKTPAAYFPWRHVQRWVNKIPLTQIDERPKKSNWEEFAQGATACPDCGRPPEDLRYFLVLSPEADWDAGTGQLGILTLCDRCRTQVSFLVHPEATEAQARQWREQRTLVGNGQA